MSKKIETEITIHATPEKYGKYYPIFMNIQTGTPSLLRSRDL
jgi:hypothetical protein